MAFSQADIEAFDRATPEDPVFVKGSFWTEHPVHGTEVLASRGTAAVMGPDVIDNDDAYDDYSYGYEEPKYNIMYLDQDNIGNPDYIHREPGHLDLIKLDDISDGEVIFDPKVEEQYRACVKARENAPFIVTMQLYSETPVYKDYDLKHEFPDYEPILGTEKVLDLTGKTLNDGSRVNSSEALEKYMLENHPTYLMGYQGIQKVPSGSYVSTAVPCVEYHGFEKSFSSRMEYAKMRAEALGVQLGPDETKQALKEAGVETDASSKKPRPLPDISWIKDVPNGPDYRMPGDY